MPITTGQVLLSPGRGNPGLLIAWEHLSCAWEHAHGLDTDTELSSSSPRPLAWHSGGFLADGLAGEDLSHCDADGLSGAEQGRESISACAQLGPSQSPGFLACFALFLVQLAMRAERSSAPLLACNAPLISLLVLNSLTAVDRPSVSSTGQSRSRYTGTSL